MEGKKLSGALQEPVISEPTETIKLAKAEVDSAKEIEKLPETEFEKIPETEKVKKAEKQLKKAGKHKGTK